MASHPNRGPTGPFSNPTPQQVREAREAAGMTQSEAARLVLSSLSAWQRWEAPSDDEQARRMHPGLFRLFLLETITFGSK
jgi:putative transcriptional regulator